MCSSGIGRFNVEDTMKVEVARRLFSFTDKEIHILVSVVLAVFVFKIAKRTCKSGAA